jgi:hypothetical protein
MSFPDGLRPLAEVCDEMGKDKLRKELVARRLIAYWYNDENDVHHPITVTHWRSNGSARTLETGEWRDYQSPQTKFKGIPPLDFPRIRAVFVAPAGVASSSAKPHPGGRPAPYEWEEVLIHLVRHIHDEGLPKTQSALVRVMQDWFDGKGKIPSDTQMKERARRIFQEFGSMGGN